MKFTNKYIFLTLSFAILSLVACDKDDPIIPNEEELITTLTYTLTPATGGSPVVLRFQDLDGDGGNAPTITGGTLAANTRYSGAVILLNEAENPAENITEEVEEEAAEHQFFYTISGANLTVSYADSDSNNNPIGIQTELSTGNASSGNLTVILRHEPNKSASGVASGSIANAGGETDIEVTFPIIVQ